ncbi:MAG: hypothetical protein ACI8PT_004312 [Gammaproteobacteria bacterium]|jgi:hypothetical protein
MCLKTGVSLKPDASFKDVARGFACSEVVPSRTGREGLRSLLAVLPTATPAPMSNVRLDSLLTTNMAFVSVEYGISRWYPRLGAI